MHFNNYISRSAAEAIEDREVTVTPTALKQTPESTIRYLKDKGIKVKTVESRGRPRKLDERQIKKVLTMKKSEASFYRIARLTGIPKSTAFDYFQRYGHRHIDKDEVDSLQLQEARKVFRQILAQDPGGEIGALAQRGCDCTDLREMEYIARELNEVIQEGPLE